MEKKKLKKLTLKKDVVAELTHPEMKKRQGGYEPDTPMLTYLGTCLTDHTKCATDCNTCNEQTEFTCNTCGETCNTCEGRNTCVPYECGGGSGAYECGVTTTFSVGCYY